MLQIPEKGRSAKVCEKLRKFVPFNSPDFLWGAQGLGGFAESFTWLAGVLAGVGGIFQERDKLVSKGTAWNIKSAKSKRGLQKDLS